MVDPEHVASLHLNYYQLYRGYTVQKLLSTGSAGNKVTAGTFLHALSCFAIEDFLDVDHHHL